MTVEVFAPAKINLTLHVTGRRADGYHKLDSLVAFADIGDTIQAAPAEGLSLTIDGPYGAGLPVQGNLVLRAAGIARGQGGAALHLTKRLPPASGIGGGSSDAAATLIALAALRGTALPQADVVTALGADVPVCLTRRACRMRGLGDHILPLAAPLPPLDVLLVNPGVAVATPDVFRGLTTPDNPGMGAVPIWRDAAEFCAWLKDQRNDLTAPARLVAPEIGTVLCALAATAPLFAGMSGSGATCFALYPPGAAAAAACAALGAAHPSWWCASGRLMDFPAVQDIAAEASRGT